MKQFIKILFLVCVGLPAVFVAADQAELPKKYITLHIPGVARSSHHQSSDAVVQSWHDAIQQHKILADDGKAIIRDLLTRDCKQHPATLDEARAVIWHLFEHSVAMGHGFAEGTWVICGEKDELSKITAFFMSAADPKGIVATVKNKLLPDKKRRLSSHFREWNSKHYGIDLSGLPVGKRHLLFSSPVAIDGSETLAKMYLKIENYGVSTLSDFLLHTKEYVGLEDRRHQYFRKEKLPDAIKKIWLQQAPLLGISAVDVHKASKEGIWKMKALLARVARSAPIPSALHNALASYHQHAKGNEVIIELMIKGM